MVPTSYVSAAEAKRNQTRKEIVLTNSLTCKTRERLDIEHKSSSEKSIQNYGRFNCSFCEKFLNPTRLVDLGRLLKMGIFPFVAVAR